MTVLQGSRTRIIASVLTVLGIACQTGTATALKAGLESPVEQNQHPQILYVDIQSGPTEGGENNQGVYLSIFGKGFGEASDLGLKTRVYIGGHQVYGYRYLGPSHGRPDIQEITVQVGSLDNIRQGQPLPIEVRVSDSASNTNIAFTPNPGTIYFVDNVTGDDATGVPGDIAHPYRYVQTSSLTAGGVWPHMRPGDFIVMRGHGTPWTDVGFQGFFARFANTPGTAPNGNAGSGPITLMGYPGEDASIEETYSVSHRGALAGVNGGVLNKCGMSGNEVCSQWVTIADLRIEGGGKDGPVNMEIAGNHWRVVNNVLSARTAAASARSGGVAGNGANVAILGNAIGDVDSPDPGLENHGIYIDGPGSYRIEYNFIHDVPGGSGIQIYSDQSPNGEYRVNNVTVSHNWIGNVAKYCVNVADHAGSNFNIYSNVASNCGMAGIRIMSTELQNARVYNNTFCKGNARRHPHYGVITIDSRLQTGAVTFMNNIFVPAGNSPYMGGDMPLFELSSGATFTNNLYYGGIGTPKFDSHPIMKDPLFVNAPRGDFHLRKDSVASLSGSQAVQDVVDTAYDLRKFSSGKDHEIGAYAAK